MIPTNRMEGLWNMKKTEIYYFSGTGNSLYVARELKKRIPETTLIPLVNLSYKDNVQTNSETVGFIFPIHLTMTPLIVQKFIENLSLKSADYIFAIATRAGTQHRAFKDVENILKRKDRSLNAYFTLNMASNDPKREEWHAATEAEISILENEVQNNLDFIQKIILNKQKSHEEDNTYKESVPGFTILSWIFPYVNRFYNVDFYSDSKCVGCGTCEKVCLSFKIKMNNGKPVWQENVECFLCNACLNYCPNQAIQIKSSRFFKMHTKDNGRYSHPYATADDIARQK